VLSRLTLRRRGSDLSSRFVVTDRELLSVSPPMLTPYTSASRIDVAALETFLHRSYAAAGVGPKDVDTGAVIITGEALNKENAPQIADLFARWSGDFICVSAGPNHEAVLAAHGSGSVALSERTGSTVLTIDVGGGTTKVALIEHGVITHVEAFSVGARLVAFDDERVVTRIEDPLHAYGCQLPIGATISDDELDRLAAAMAGVVGDAIVAGPHAALRRALMVTPASVPSRQHDRPIDHIVFSGGVSEYIDGRDDTSYGDLGPALGTHIRKRLGALGLLDRLAPAAEGIRATVLGASQFSVQASGQTCFVPDQSLLPVRNLPVVRVELSPDTDPEQAIEAALRRRDLSGMTGELALALGLHGRTDYLALRGYAEALVRAAGPALVLVLEADLARSLGRIIVRELGFERPVVVIDGISVGDLDYLDIGRLMGSTKAFPVTVKSLTFGSDKDNHG
jgi:ethanolamine utilization protein EutA